MKYHQKFIQGIWNLLIGSVLIILLTQCNPNVINEIVGPDSYDWPEAVATHNVVKGDNALEMLWSRSNIFSESNFGLRMAATKEMVFILGSTGQTEDEAVLAFDAVEGTLLWRSSPEMKQTLYATPSTLYVGSGGIGGVTAYELATGQILWSEQLQNSRSVIYLYVFDNTIHVNSVPEIFHLMKADTGEVIQTLRYDFGQKIFVVTNEVTFKQSTLATLQAVETESGAPIWEANVKQEYLLGPVFTEETIFIRTERGLGSVYAIDRQTGKILWHTERKVISNVTTTKRVVYLLTLDGELLGLDSRTGKKISSVKFEPSSFILEDSEYHPREYHVAVDEQAGLLYALLEDSRQLFAFRIVPDP